MKRSKVPKPWYSVDVHWHHPKYKKPIAYSTVAASNAIAITSKDTGCRKPTDLIKHFEPFHEEYLILKAYIDKGLGDFELTLS